ncbi:putative short-subunit dehydrogenase-like oxidoreductase (DUF2520 family) [Silvimonas terrae]|uniref:Putative short-subunit dehydrogenase-like oxidoreductase (DUF2520 family) n=1 Tax=Silvimonas terrae TaxID=300266 RepID=A0A840RJK5_9NEIS|nr:Rossmann-like and DUF2520 domain-containing protein [Silvimonas terrae]MBB5192698.1 putative short-subunit dehydrogenase-like oxidoreductase (DUF2520 family) [Silvimonas terrae]
MSLPALNIIGPGRLAQTLGRLWHERASVRVADLLARDAARGHAAAAFIGAGRVVDWDGLTPAAITLLATPDDAIAGAVPRLASQVRPGDVVFHCSGALSSAVLAPLRNAGAVLASVHPLFSFADPAHAVTRFAGTWCAAEGDTAALDVLLPLFDQIGAQRFTIAASGKLLYHAGAVLACNHLVALMETALRSMEGAGIPRDAAWSALKPLIDGTLANLDRYGPAQALTGPAARNDLGIIAQEIAATTALDPATGETYRVLTDVALQLAARKS